MKKEIDLSQSVYSLCAEYPELVEVLVKLGFKDITKPGMMQTAGRVMTIPKGASMKKISLQEIEKELLENGFTIKEEV